MNGMRMFLAAALGAAMGCMGGGGDRAPDAATLLITDVHVLDVQEGAFGEPVDVVVGGDEVFSIGEVRWRDTTVAVLVGEGGFLLPGLEDSHVHLSQLALGGDSALVEVLGAFVSAGVLRVRDMGGPLEVVATLAARVESGQIVGPKISFAGPMAERPPLFWEQFNSALPGFTVPISNEDDVRGLVGSVAEAGGSHVKVFGKWDRALLRDLLDQARQASLGVVLDPGQPLFQDVPVDTALSLGIARIEHAISPWQSILAEPFASGHDRLWTEDAAPSERVLFANGTIPQGLETVNRTRLTDLAQRWAAAGVYFCPTLQVLEGRRTRPLPLPHTTREEDWRGFWTGMADVGELVVQEFSDAGVRLVVGQDGWSPSGTVGEMLALESAGVSRAEIIRAATTNPASWAGESESWGRLEPGMAADMILVEYDPLQSIAVLKLPRAVVQAGVVRVGW